MTLASFEDVVYAILWLAPFLAIAGAIVFVGYVAFVTRGIRERAVVEATHAGPDPALELEKLHAEVAQRLAEARRTLEAARDTVRRGIRG